MMTQRPYAATLGVRLTLVAGLILALGMAAPLRAGDPPAGEEPEKQGLAAMLADDSKDDDSESGETKKEGKAPQVVRFDITGSITETGAQSGFGAPPKSLRKMLLALGDAAEDEDIEAIVLRINDASAGLAITQELHNALLEVREHKPIHAFVTGGGMKELLLAASCSDITVPPTHEWFLNGAGLDLMYFKRLLANIGVEFEVLQMGKYKSAMEPFASTSASDATRESYQALVDTIFEEVADGVAEGREMSPAMARNILSGGFYDTKQALDLDIVDHVDGELAFNDRLAEEYGEDFEFVDDYGSEDKDLDTSNPFALFQELFGEQSEEEAEENTIALLYMIGGVEDGAPTEAAYEDQSISAYPLVAQLEALRKDDNVKAVVIRIDSGGGSAFASDQIWTAVKRCAEDKPVVASMGDVAASGGYYIPMGADYIFALPMTITGSIGVIGGKPNAKGLYDKIGLDTDSVSRGRTSNMFEINRAWRPEERAILMDLMNRIYVDFKTKVAECRGKTVDEIQEIAQGRVWSGRDALEIGLIDELGGLFDAVDKAEELAGLDPEADNPLAVYPKKLSFQKILERMLGVNSGFSASAFERAMGPAALILPEGVKYHAELMIKLLQQDHVAVMMPVHLEIK